MISRSWKEEVFSSAWRHCVLSTSFVDRIKSSLKFEVLETDPYLAYSMTFLLCNILYFLSSPRHSSSNHLYQQREGCIHSQAVSIKHCICSVSTSEKDVEDGYVML